ncbi:MAG: protease complex subunit PrcB family protein [Candidatus Thiodiazotropha sp. (ex Lucinoma borealis)]|nr:protease complex subunit PrcB family protein [Candidatus Thiodiazotropha sp. (ex Lucinoma borealis)]
MKLVNLNKWIRWMGLAPLFMAISSCNTVASSVSVLEQGYVCSVNQAAGVQLVSDSALTHGDGARIGAKVQKDISDKIETEQFWVVRVDMGQQPSGGYGLKLLSDHLELASDAARVAVEWVKPKPGMVQMQALTYPCLYLKIAKGNFTRLEIVDHQGEVRHSLALN